MEGEIGLAYHDTHGRKYKVWGTKLEELRIQYELLFDDFRENKDVV